MDAQVNRSCEQHPDRSDCPDCLIAYTAKFREYGIFIHDGGTSKMSIRYCPWCGGALPESERDRWFRELARRGIDPSTEDVPDEFTDERWLTTQ